MYHQYVHYVNTIVVFDLVTIFYVGTLCAVSLGMNAVCVCVRACTHAPAHRRMCVHSILDEVCIVRETDD